MSAYLDDELDKTQMCEITNHLRQCADCEALLRDMSGLTGRFGSLLAEQPEQEPLTQRILEKLPERRAVNSLPRFSWRMTGMIGGGLVVAAILLAFGQLWYPFLRMLFKVLGQFLYVPLLMLADKQLLQWAMALAAFIAVVVLIRLLRAKPGDKEESS